jgi:RNA:NAD 2'-phosphotransferase (TPT1/KptA family)
MNNSRGTIEHWQLTFRCAEGFDATAKKMKSPKAEFRALENKKIDDVVKTMAADDVKRFRLNSFL